MQTQTAQSSFSGKSSDINRTYLTDVEVEQLIAAARSMGRYGHRDALMIQMAYRHGLRASELVNLRWDYVMLDKGTLHVERLKHGDASIQPLTGPELRALRQLKRDQDDSAFVFTTERKGPMETSGLRKIVARAGIKAGFGKAIHPHMLRHACGHQLANHGVDTRAIQGYLGHKNIQSTVRYTQLASDRFKDFVKIL